MSNKLPSVAYLIATYSHTRVKVPSQKRFVVGVGPTGLPTFSRQMDRGDAIAQMLRRYAH